MRRLVRIGLVLVGLVAMTVWLAPMIAGSKWVYDPIVQSFARDKLDLKIGRVSLSWFRPIVLSQITVSEWPTPNSPPPTPLLTLDSVETDRGLLSFLWNRNQLGRLVLNEPKIDIALLEDDSNLRRIIRALKGSNNSDEGSSQSPEVEKDTKAFDIDVSLRNMSVLVSKDGLREPLVVVPPFNADVAYRSVSQDPIVKVAATKVLDQVRLTPELVKLGLDHAAPLLAKSAWFDGRVSLDVSDLTIPVDHPIDAIGAASLTMHQVRTGPTEPLIIEAIEFLSRLRNRPDDRMELVFVDGSKIDVSIQETRVTHSGLEAGLPQLDERLQISSSGSIGLSDKGVDIEIQVPVPVEQLARRDAVKQLGVPRLRIPVHGTLTEPMVDWNEFRKDSGLLLAMMAGQLEDQAPILGGVLGSLGGVAEGNADDAIAAASEMLQELRERRQRRREAEREGSPPAEEDRPATRRPVLDALRRSLGR
jgi:hypothetical protein